MRGSLPFHGPGSIHSERALDSTASSGRCERPKGSRATATPGGPPALSTAPVLPTDVSGQPQPRQPVEHQDGSRGESYRGVLALPGQGREGAGSGEAARALEAVPSQVRGQLAEPGGGRGQATCTGGRCPATLHTRPTQSTGVSSHPPAPLAGSVPRTSATPSVTSFTRPTSIAWWRSAARFSAPWTGPSSMPSEWGSVPTQPHLLLCAWCRAPWGWRLHRPLPPSEQDPYPFPTRPQPLGWLLLRRRLPRASRA